MKNEFEASVLCNESEFPTYPRPHINANKNASRSQLNWSFLEPNTSINLNYVSSFILFSLLVIRLLSKANGHYFKVNFRSYTLAGSKLFQSNCVEELVHCLISKCFQIPFYFGLLFE